jgi:exopolysaccharide production protein ExoZ
MGGFYFLQACNSLGCYVIGNIQILRSLAAIMVVFYHASGMMHNYGFNYNDVFGIAHWGTFGVDIFFVISGFIMSYMISMKRQSAYSFFLNRVKRIAPIYWLLTLTLIFIQQVFPSIFNGKLSGIEQSISSFLFISSHQGFSYPTLYVGWTLECEMYFYLMFSLSLLCNLNDKLRLTALPVLIIASVYFEIVPPISLEFIYGVVLFHLYKASASLINNDFFKFFSIVSSVVAMGFVVLHKNVNVDLRPFERGIPAFIIVGSSLYLKQVSKGVFSELGNASYSIYLFQVFALSLGFKLIKMFSPGINGYVVVFLTSMFSIILGVLCYYLIEKKLTAFVNNGKVGLWIFRAINRKETQS